MQFGFPLLVPLTLILSLPRGEGAVRVKNNKHLW